MAGYGDVPNISSEELFRKFKIPKWFREYEIRLEWENYAEKSPADPVAFGGTIERAYFRKGETCFVQLTIKVARFRQVFRTGTVVQYLYIRQNAVARLLLKLSTSGMKQLNKTVGGSIGPNKKEILTVGLELLSIFRGTPLGSLLAELIKADDALGLLKQFEEIADLVEKNRKELTALLGVTRIKLSETPDVTELVSLIRTDPLIRTLVREIPCDDWIRKLDDGVIGKRDEPLDDMDIRPGQTPEGLLEDLAKRAQGLKF